MTEQERDTSPQLQSWRGKETRANYSSPRQNKRRGWLAGLLLLQPAFLFLVIVNQSDATQQRKDLLSWVPIPF